MNRVLTVAEALALPPLTAEELAERRSRMQSMIASARQNHEDFLARGAVPMTEAEWKEFWYSLDADDPDEDDSSGRAMKTSVAARIGP